MFCQTPFNMDKNMRANDGELNEIQASNATESGQVESRHKWIGTQGGRVKK